MRTLHEHASYAHDPLQQPLHSASAAPPLMSFPLPSDEAPSRAEPAPPQLLLLPPEGYQAPTPELSIDALPYIDTEYNEPQLKAHVHQLITAEMQSSPRPLSSYLASLSTLPSLASLPSSQPSYTSPAAALAPLSTAHLSCFPSPPPSLASTSSPYPSAPVLTSPASLTLHSSLLLHSDVSHELLRHYGAQQQSLIGQHLRSRRDALKAAVEEEGRRVEDVNRERKRRQTEEVQAKLHFCHTEYWRLFHSTQAIQRSLHALDTADAHKRSRLS